MKPVVSVEEAEAIRNRLGLTHYEFARKIGMSDTAYRQAVKREKIGKYMAFRIAMHCSKYLAEVRS